MGFSLAFVPVYLYPILKKINAPLAMAYVVFRGALETTVYLLSTLSMLLLTILSHEYVNTKMTDLNHFKTLGEILQKSGNTISTLLIIVFSINAFILYSLFYQSKLIPRWISIWGIIAITSHFITAFLIMFHVVKSDMATIVVIMNMPILFQEMVMAVWLIVKGFNPEIIIPKNKYENITISKQ
jgi:hypothetical protein